MILLKRYNIFNGNIKHESLFIKYTRLLVFWIGINIIDIPRVHINILYIYISSFLFSFFIFFKGFNSTSTQTETNPCSN